MGDGPGQLNAHFNIQFNTQFNTQFNIRFNTMGRSDLREYNVGNRKLSSINTSLSWVPTMPVYDKRWFRVGIALLVLVGVLVILTPVGLRYAMLHWLRENGAPAATLEDVDFNPFNGQLTIKQLLVPGAGDAALRIDEASANLEWTGLLRKRLYLSNLELRDAHITVARADDHLTVGGIEVYRPDSEEDISAGSQAPFSWGLGLDQMTLDNVKIRYHDPELDSELEFVTLRLSDVYSWRRESPSALQIDVRLNGSPMIFRGTVTPFDEQPAAEIGVEANDIKLSFLDVIAKAHGIDDLQGIVGINFRIKVRQEDPGVLAVATAGEFSLDKFRVRNLDYVVDDEKLRWKGESSVRVAKETFDVSTKGQLSANELRITDARKSLVLAAIGGIELSGIAVNGPDDISVKQIEIGDTRIVPPRAAQDGAEKEVDAPLLTAKQALINEIRATNLKDVGIRRIQLSGLGVTLVRDSKGTLSQIETLLPSDEKDTSEVAGAPATGETDESAKSASEKSAPPVSVRVEELEIMDNSRIAFEDRSIKPYYPAVIEALHVRVGKLDSTTPEQATPVLVDGKGKRQATFNLKGKMKPFEKPPAVELEIAIKSVDLQPFSGYSRKLIGYDIQSGRLTLDTLLKIGDNQINAENKIFLQNFKLESVDSEKSEEVTAELSMPLDTALDLLRDKRDNIKIEVPITGRLDDPNVNISNAINQALVSATKRTTMTYLKYAMQPWGGILLATEFVAGQATAIRFEPVPFAAGSATLEDDALPYLKKMAKLLEERSKLQLTLCGRAVPADRQALLEQAQGKRGQRSAGTDISEEQLQEFAERRSVAVRDRLVKLGVDSERLFLCSPKFVDDESAQPGVDILL